MRRAERGDEAAARRRVEQVGLVPRHAVGARIRRDAARDGVHVEPAADELAQRRAADEAARAGDEHAPRAHGAKSG